MYLEKILGTKTKIRILNELVNNPDNTYKETELAKIIDCSLSEVNRQIKDFVICGLVRMNKIGRTKLYSINKSHFLFKSLKNLFINLNAIYRKISKEIINYVTKKHEIECVILIGSLARGKIAQDFIEEPSDIDLIFITKDKKDMPKIKKSVLEYVREKINIKYGINVYPIVISKKEYLDSLKNDEFIINAHVTGEVLYGRKPI